MASYSNNYAFNLPNGNQCFFLVKVLLGKCFASPPNGGLNAPPFIPGTNIRYDSVRGNNMVGQNEHIVYTNNRAYPYYLIEYNRGIAAAPGFGGAVPLFGMGLGGGVGGYNFVRPAFPAI